MKLPCQNIPQTYKNGMLIAVRVNTATGYKDAQETHGVQLE